MSSQSSHGIKIAITGGPSGGKTTFIEALKKELGQKITVVPESASILYKGGFPRIKTKEAAAHTQKVIFYLQHELEDLMLQEYPNHILICDRGTLDGVAYWPYGEENFFEVLNTQRSHELQRYQWVIHLDTASEEYYETSNPIRTESFKEALEINQRIKNSWAGHPQRIIIPQNQDFLNKMTLCLKIIKSIGAGDNYQEILQWIPQPK